MGTGELQEFPQILDVCGLLSVCKLSEKMDKGVRVLHGLAPPEQLGSWGWGWDRAEEVMRSTQTPHMRSPHEQPLLKCTDLFSGESFSVRTGIFSCGHSIFPWLSRGESLISSNAIHGWENACNRLLKENCSFILLQQTGDDFLKAQN